MKKSYKLLMTGAFFMFFMINTLVLFQTNVSLNPSSNEIGTVINKIEVGYNDTFEENDDIAEAKMTNVSLTYPNLSINCTDPDWYKVDLQEDYAYDIVCTINNAEDLEFNLYTGFGDLLASSVVDGSDRKININIIYTETYFIRVESIETIDPLIITNYTLDFTEYTSHQSDYVDQPIDEDLESGDSEADDKIPGFTPFAVFILSFTTIGILIKKYKRFTK